MLHKKYNQLRAAIQQEVDQFDKDFPDVIRSECASLQSLNPFTAYMSASRAQMAGSHIESSIRTVAPTRRRCYTGYESEYGKTVYKISAPCDMAVLQVITRYGHSYDNIAEEDNPETLVVYENIDTREIGLLKIPGYVKTSEQFGVIYKMNDSVDLRNGAVIKKDTVLATSPSVDDDGVWRFGTEMTVCYLSDPRVIQDGIVASKSACKILSSKGIGSRTFSFGSNKFPLNLYGDANEYKILPDIGETVADHRMLVAFRRKDGLLAPIKLAPAMLRLNNFDPLGDEAIHIGQGERNAKIIDIRVHYQAPDGQPLTPVGMADQLDRYRDSSNQVSLRLYKYYKQLLKNNPYLTITGEFQNELKACLSEFKNFDKEERYAKGISDLNGTLLAKKMLSGSLLDEYYVEVIYEYDIVADIGSKVTNVLGGKGIIVRIEEDEDMPTDADGNRAHFIFGDLSNVKRTIPGALYEQALNAYSRDLTRAMLPLIESDPIAAYDWLLEYYRICSPRMLLAELDYIITTEDERLIQQHIYSTLQDIKRDGVDLWLPLNNPRSLFDVIKELVKAKFPITYGPVTFRDVNGNMVTSREKVLIGSVYMVLLDKLNNGWASVASAKLQHYGLTTRLNSNDKHSTPTREQPTRWGETELRIEVAVSDGMEHHPAELLDRINNPSTHKNIIENIVDASNPMQLKNAVNRKKVPRGGSRPILFIKHAMLSLGVEMVSGDK